MIDHAGHVARAEAVVDVHHRDPAGAGIQHTQQRGDPAEAGPVAHAGGHGDHRAVGQTPDHRGQRPLHTGHGHDDPGAHDLLQVAQQPVDAGDAHVVEPDDPVAQGFGGHGGLLGHVHIAGAAGGDHHSALARGLRQLPHDARSGQGIVAQGQLRPHQGGGLPAHAGDEHGLLPRLPHGPCDAQDVLRGLARAVDDLGHALAQPPVQIHLGVGPELPDGRGLQLQNRLLHRGGTGRDALQQGGDLLFIHAKPPPYRRGGPPPPPARGQRSPPGA